MIRTKTAKEAGFDFLAEIGLPEQVLDELAERAGFSWRDSYGAASLADAVEFNNLLLQNQRLQLTNQMQMLESVLVLNGL